MAAPALTVFGVHIPWDAGTLEGFRAWATTLDERGPRVSFARGTLHVERSPQSYQTHEPLVGAINERLRGLARELDLGRYFLPPSWFTHEASALSTEPDGFLASWSSLEDGTLRINPERTVEMLGRPDMVLEVVSDSSERKDLVEHVDDYATAGVREYWIADGRAEHPTLAIHALDERGVYVGAVPDAEGWIWSPLWQRRFRLQRLADRVGLRDFSLDVRE